MIKRKMSKREIIRKRIDLELKMFAVLKEKSKLRLFLLEEALAEIDGFWEKGSKKEGCCK